MYRRGARTCWSTATAASPNTSSGWFGEEMLFRGFVFTRLMRLMPPGRLGLSVSLGLQSLVFGALHYAYGPGTALVAAVLGLVLGGVYLVGGRNLWAAILLHGLIDTTSISVAYFVGVKP
jgi:hypothetical protein